MHEINGILQKYRKNRDEFRKQQLCRIGLIVSMLEKLGNAKLSLDQYLHDEIFSNETEKLIAYEIISNPIYSDLLKKIAGSSFFTSDPDASTVLF